MVGEVPEPPQQEHHQSFWLWVMCLTGVDYFSTLGYLPSIAYEATGRLAPLATVVLVFVTLFGALPIYSYVASRSPNGLGSIALLERVVRGWTGKLLVLVLLGFVGTAFFFTKTLSAADAAEHLIHNPLWQKMPDFVHDLPENWQRIVVTMVLLTVLAAVFWRGFREVIGIAVVIVAVYLVLNAIIIISGIYYLIMNPQMFQGWLNILHEPEYWDVKDAPFESGEWWAIAALCLYFFPKLALGLSGFETGLMVMPLIKGDPSDDPHHPKVRIRNTRKLLTTAAIIMCFYLLGSSLITATLIDPAALRAGGPAANRALAYVAHGQGFPVISPLFGEVFGTIYDLSTVVILWFAGASAMAGLLNLIPQYLPRYGMAPEWARAIRPLILLYTVVNLIITILFDASVIHQAGAYATGVLVFIASGCVATVIDRWKIRGEGRNRLANMAMLGLFSLISLMFFYTTVAIMIERPDGIGIALVLIITILAACIWSRAQRSTELRFSGFQFVDPQSKFLWESMEHLEFPVLVPHRPGRRDLSSKEEDIRREHRLGAEIPIVFLESQLGDVSEFWQQPLLEVIQQEGRFILRVSRCASIPHVIAAVGLEMSRHGQPPEIHFGWSDESPLTTSIGFLLFGEGNVPWLVRELIRRAESDPERQPRIIVG